MPWKSVKPMEEKIRFIGDYLSRVFNFTELCEQYGISVRSEAQLSSEPWPAIEFEVV